MSIELPNPRTIFPVTVPSSIQDPALVEYLDYLRRAIEEVYIKAFDNADAIRSVINTGTTGTFVDSTGNTITVKDGLITALT